MYGGKRRTSRKRHKFKIVKRSAVGNSANKKTAAQVRLLDVGGDKWDRTADLLNAIQALSRVIQLHTPTYALRIMWGRVLLWISLS